MDAKTLAALRGSIEKWRAIEEGREADKGPTNCPLCKRFKARLCDGCPVERASKSINCRDTPYEAFAEWDFKRGNGWHAPLNPRIHTKGVRLARAEREFLESLLPDGEKP